MEKLYENFGITILLMFIVALFDYIIIPLGGFELAIGMILVWIYFIGWIIVKVKESKINKGKK